MNTTKVAEKFEIMNGPSKDLLFDACKYVFSKSAKIAIEFSVASGYTRPEDNPRSAYVMMAMSDVKIIRIEHEDGSGESFNLYGTCRANTKPFGKTIDGKWYTFVAYYNTKNRKGDIALTEK